MQEIDNEYIILKVLVPEVKERFLLLLESCYKLSVVRSADRHERHLQYFETLLFQQSNILSFQSFGFHHKQVHQIGDNNYETTRRYNIILDMI